MLEANTMNVCAFACVVLLPPYALFPPPLTPRQPALQSLKLQKCRLTSWMAAPDQTFLPCLTFLNLAGNRLADVADVARCPALLELHVQGNALQDAEGFLQTLRALPFLERAAFADNPLTEDASQRLSALWPGAQPDTSQADAGCCLWRLGRAGAPELDGVAWSRLAPALHQFLSTTRDLRFRLQHAMAGQQGALYALAGLLSMDPAVLSSSSVARLVDALQPPSELAAPPASATAAATRIQAWWRGARVRLQIDRALGAAAFEDDDDFLYDDVDIGEFDMGLDLLDKEYADLRPPEVIADAEKRRATEHAARVAQQAPNAPQAAAWTSESRPRYDRHTPGVWCANVVDGPMPNPACVAVVVAALPLRPKAATRHLMQRDTAPLPRPRRSRAAKSRERARARLCVQHGRLGPTPRRWVVGVCLCRRFATSSATPTPCSHAAPPCSSCRRSSRHPPGSRGRAQQPRRRLQLRAPFGARPRRCRQLQHRRTICRRAQNAQKR